MLSRRKFISTSTAIAALAPFPVFSQTPEPFVLPEKFQRQIVRVRKEFEPGQLIILPQKHFLYFVFETGKALRYGVGVGKAGLAWKGTATIDRKAKWPSWRPTNAMIAREPGKYAQHASGVPGGINNPLGARALYLYKNGRDTYFRIHGTNQPWTIGKSVSNGCIRMLNEHVKDLYERVPVGTVVTVL